MHSSTILAGIIAASAVASSDAFMGASPALRAYTRPAVALGRAPAIRMMADEPAAAPAGPKVGEAAEKYSKGFAHPKPVLVDADIRKILPHRSVSLCAPMG